MFMALEEQDMEVVIDAMDEKKVEAGSDVIVEGENGDELYVVEEGKLDCYKKFVSIDSFTKLEGIARRCRGKTLKDLRTRRSIW
jgi:hypothetical protein